MRGKPHQGRGPSAADEGLGLPATVAEQHELVGVQRLQRAPVADADDRALRAAARGPSRTSRAPCPRPGPRCPRPGRARTAGPAGCGRTPSRCCSPGDSVLDQGASSSSRPIRWPSCTARSVSRSSSSSRPSAGIGIGQRGPQAAQRQVGLLGAEQGMSPLGRAIEPSTCGHRPAMLRSNVVLPLPDGPLTSRADPPSRFRSRWLSIGRPSGSRTLRSWITSPLELSRSSAPGSARASSLESSRPVSRISTAR